MTTLERIVALNREQRASESDPFTVGRYEQFVSYFSTSTLDVLDVGCNTGRGGTIMKNLRPNLHITGLDCVPERVAALDPRAYDAKICGFSNAVPCEADSFDAIVAGEFIEHILPESVFPTLCEFFRLLRLRGQLLLTTPHPRYWKNRLQGRSVLGGAHISQHYPANLKRRLMDIGFSNVTIRGSGRVSTVLGEHFPFQAAYGSYLARAVKW